MTRQILNSASDNNPTPVSRLYYSCDGSGHFWLIDTCGSGNQWNWEYTPLGMCGGGRWIEPLMPVFSGSNGGNGGMGGKGFVRDFNNSSNLSSIALNSSFQFTDRKVSESDINNIKSIILTYLNSER